MDLWPGGDGWLCGPGAVLWSTGENGDFGKSSTWETVLVADHKHIPFIAVCPIATLRGRQHTKAECKSQDGHESHRRRDRVSFKNRCARRSHCWHQLPLQERQGQTRLWDLCCFPMDWRKCVTRQTTICSCLDSWWYCWSGGYYNLVRLVSFLSFFVENCLDAVEPVWVAGVDPQLLGPESGSTAFDTSSAVLLGQTQACISNSEYSKLVWGQCGKDPCCKQGIIFAVPSSCYSKEHPWRGCSEPVCVTLQGFWSGWARKSFPLRGVICSSFWRRMWTLRAATNLQAFVRKGSMGFARAWERKLGRVGGCDIPCGLSVLKKTSCQTKCSLPASWSAQSAVRSDITQPPAFLCFPLSVPFSTHHGFLWAFLFFLETWCSLTCVSNESIC